MFGFITSDGVMGGRSEIVSVSPNYLSAIADYTLLCPAHRVTLKFAQEQLHYPEG